MYPGTYAKTQPEKAAVIRAATGEVLTYAELDRRSSQLARVLRQAGLVRGDHVALILENHLAYFEVVWACMRSGLYFTPINYHLSAAEAAYIVDNCDAKALLASATVETSAQVGAQAARCAIKLAIGGPSVGCADYEAALAAQPALPPAQETLGTMMLYSSGTTGKPKGIRRNLPTVPVEQGSPQLQFIINNFGFDASTVYLSPAPMYHGSPVGYTSAVLQAGGTVVMMDRFDAAEALALIERHHITASQWVPTMFVRLLKLDPEVRARHDLSSHRMAIHAAAPCPIEVKRQMIDWWGPILEEYYSSTESAGFARIGSAEWLTKPGSVGQSKGQPFHICDEDGTELPLGEPGVIYGEAPAGGRFVYHKDEEKTAAAAHPLHEDWRTVGDIGLLDEDGYLFLTDRKSFMIISGGVNIYPQQIENVLALHPLLHDVAVIGVPNPDLGEEVKAVVQPAEGVAGSAALAQELQDFVREKLGKQLTPRSVDFVETLPRLPTGKLAKHVLRDRYWPKPAPV